MLLSQFFPTDRVLNVLKYFSSVVGLIASLAVGLSTPADADLRLCNRTEVSVSVSLGHLDQDVWVTEGWWNIPKTACEVLYRGDLEARYYYLHAIDSLGGRWKGSTSMCVDRVRFKVRGTDGCRKRGFSTAEFFEVDTRQLETWTVDLLPQSPEEVGLEVSPTIRSTLQ